MNRVLPTTILSAAAMLALSACSMIKSITPDWHIPSLPKLSLPSLPSLPSRNTIAKIIPGMSETDKVGSEDPTVPFNSRGTLGFGHTLRIEVYEGSRGPDRIYRDIVMVNEKGELPLADVGTARVGGLQLPQAAEAISSVFRVAGRNTRPITVHIISVENTPVISINGDVLGSEFIPVFDNITVRSALNVSGGRKLGSTKRGVYITRSGVRSFFTSLDAATDKWDPQAGDIITLSPDI